MRRKALTIIECPLQVNTLRDFVYSLSSSHLIHSTAYSISTFADCTNQELGDWALQDGYNLAKSVFEGNRSQKTNKQKDKKNMSKGMKAQKLGHLREK